MSKSILAWRGKGMTPTNFNMENSPFRRSVPKTMLQGDMQCSPSIKIELPISKIAPPGYRAMFEYGMQCLTLHLFARVRTFSLNLTQSADFILRLRSNFESNGSRRAIYILKLFIIRAPNRCALRVVWKQIFFTTSGIVLIRVVKNKN